MSQPDSFYAKGEIVSAKHILGTGEYDNKILSFDGDLLISYNKKYYARIKIPSPVIRLQSFLWLNDHETVSIDGGGNYYKKNSVAIAGYWKRKEAVSIMLPYEYLPGK